MFTYIFTVAPQAPCHSQPMSWLRDDSCPTRVWTETVDVLTLGRDARRMFLRGPSRSIYRSTTPSRHPGPVEVTTSRHITATASLTTGTAGKVMRCYLIWIPCWPLQSNSAGSNQLGTSLSYIAVFSCTGSSPRLYLRQSVNVNAHLPWLVLCVGCHSKDGS